MASITARFGLFALSLVSVLSLSGSESAAKLPAPGVQPSNAQTAQPTTAGHAERARALQSYDQLPLRFEANQGQTSAPVKYLARGGGYTLFLTSDEAVLKLRRAEERGARVEDRAERNDFELRSTTLEPQPAVLRLKLQGANPAPQLSAAEPLGGQSNYLIGDNPQAWHTQVTGYARVKYANVYPGIDLVWHGEQRQLEHDFLVAPGAQPGRIRLAFAGAQAVKLERAGALVLQTAGGAVRMRKPVAWQARAGRRRAIACAYRLNSRGEVGFALGAYDHSLPLVIDPVLVYSTYLGGMGTDQAFGIALDATGNAYVTGATDSADFPGQSAVQAAKGAQTDVFVAKLNAAGTGLLYSTWLGGNGSETGRGIAVDAAGNAYVTGFTSSTDFPTKNALQAARKGGSDVFLAKLNSAGSLLLYSTYLGGSLNDAAYGLAVDATGNVYLTGSTDSFDFPTANALQAGKRGSAFYLSANAGESWVASSNGMNVLQVYDVAVDPKNPQTIYVSTEQGLYKTTNGSAAWNRIATNQTLPLITQLLIDPANSNILYANSSNLGYKSVNGGASWEPLIGLSSNPTLALAPTNPTTLYASSRFSNVILISTDGGVTWQRGGPLRAVFNGVVNGVNAIAVDPVMPSNLYVSTNNGIFKSTDGGANFTQQIIGFVSDQQPRLDKLAISRSNPAVVYVAGAFGGLLKTTNGGASWGAPVNFPASVNAVQALAVDPNDANTVYASALNGIFKTTDGGVTWRATNNRLGGLAVRGIAFAGNSSTTVFAGTNSGLDAFVTKLNTTGSTLLNSTYLGGSGNDTGSGIAVDAANNVYLAGQTESFDLPVANAFQATLKGSSDAFAGRLNAAGSSFAWLTYLGGSDYDGGTALAINSAGNLFIAGLTYSSDFPVVNAYQATLRSLPLSGPDGFIARFSVDGSKLDYASYLGGNSLDVVRAIALDATGNAYVTGETSSTDFPVVGAARPNLPSPFIGDAFVAQLSSDGKQLGFSVYLGGNGPDVGFGIALDTAGAIYVAGHTFSDDFPTTPNTSGPHGQFDAFVTKLGLRADLALTISDLPDPVQVNGTLSYTLTVTNNGPDGAVGVAVSNTLPAGVSFVSASASNGSCSGNGPVNCALGDLAAGSSATVTIAVKPTATGTLTNRATVTASTADDTPANNAAAQETRVGTLPSIFGRVTTGSGAGVGDVTVSLTGAQRPAALTGNDGAYQFAELATGGNYSVTPARAGFVFTPPNRSVNNLTTDQRADFAATACVFTLVPASQVFQASGGAGTLTINSPDPRCAWTAQSNAPWLKLTSAASGSGAATLSYNVEPTVSARVGTLTVAGNNFIVRQAFNACPGFDFTSAPFFPLNDTTYFGRPYVQVRDFNSDGRSDVAFLTQKLNGLTGVSLALANNRAGFDTQTNALPDISLAAQYSALNAADFNGDGKLDLAATISVDNGNGRVAVAFGDGIGKFAAPTSYALSASPASLASADFNGDGKPDLVTANTVPGGRSNLSVLLNKGTGEFEAAKTVTFGSDEAYAPQFVIGDFTQDGRPDLAVLTSSRRLVILRNTGAGDFAIQSSLNTEGTALVAGDFTGDRKLDLAIYNSTEAQIWLGNGDSSFVRGALVQLDRNGAFLVSNDLNGDGRADLIASAYQSITVFYASGRGGFEAPRSFHPGALLRDFSGSLTTGDFNRDGRPDLFVLGAQQISTGPVGLAVLLAGGNGEFGAPRIFDSLPSFPPFAGTLIPVDIGSGDLNGDGNNDLVLARPDDKLDIAFGDGRGGFGAATSYSISNRPRYPALRDFNGDGKPDIAVLSVESGALTILFNNGKGEFTRSSQVPGVGRAYTFGVDDFNRDGKPDLLIKGRTGLTLLTGNGNGEFGEAATGLAASYATPFFVVGDYNGDGNPDVAVFGVSANCNDASPTPALLFGNGRGGFSAPQPFAFPVLPERCIPADLNGDGRTDLLVLNVSCSGLGVSSGIYALLAVPQGGFTTPVKLSESTSYFTAGDVNGDGWVDFLFFGAPGIAVRLGKGDGTFAEPAFVRLPREAGPVALGDFNNDGANDLLAIPSQLNRLTVLLNRSLCLSPNSLALVSAASYAPFRAASESIVALFGAALSTSTQAANTLPLPTVLNGVSVRLKDSAGVERLAPLFFISPNQINHLMPSDLAPGVAVVTVQNGAQTVATGTLLVEPVAPGLFTADASGAGLPAAVVLRVKANGAQVFESIAQFNAAQNRFTPIPIDVSDAAEQVFLILFGTGWRARAQNSEVTVKVGGELSPVLFAGAQGGLAGLDQLNLRLTPSLQGRGESEIVLVVNGKTANPVSIVIK